MSDAEWLACTDPLMMVEFLRGRSSERKLRLFASACCRRIVHLPVDERLLQVIEASERYADGDATMDEVLAAWDATDKAVWAFNGVLSEQIALVAVRQATRDLAARDCVRACQQTLEAFEQERAWLPWERRTVRWWLEMRAGVEGTVGKERRIQSDLLRCIVSNPCRPTPIATAWRTPQVVALARAIDDGRAFERMPSLGEALDEVDCDDGPILEHCRGAGPHAKGCWVIDILLGKG